MSRLMQRAGETAIVRTGEIECLDHIALVHRCGSLDAILEFAHIARPKAVGQQIERLRRDPDLAPVVLVEATDEVVDLLSLIHI